MHSNADIFRANMYRALSLLFMFPDHETAELLLPLEESVGELLPDLLPEVLKMKEFFSSGEHKLLELQKEYSRLFIGPDKLPAPPFGSVYLDPKRVIMGPSTMEVINQYRLAGLTMNQELKQPPDFIATELEFMYFLALKHLETGAEESVSRQHQFLTSQLGRWIEAFVNCINQHASLYFYLTLGSITSRFLAYELNHLCAEPDSQRQITV